MAVHRGRLLRNNSSVKFVLIAAATITAAIAAPMGG
jgi:hypothetical protein